MPTPEWLATLFAEIDEDRAAMERQRAPLQVNKDAAGVGLVYKTTEQPTQPVQQQATEQAWWQWVDERLIEFTKQMIAPQVNAAFKHLAEKLRKRDAMYDEDLRKLRGEIAALRAEQTIDRATTKRLKASVHTRRK